ncbi:hypothetical protein [Oleidesulfovibrio sp.]|uniref:hypothetical protein n=1 Tax=Oleidesulfovibrio sp. TaxID=2909707 RepID=UPI003A8806C4
MDVAGYPVERIEVPITPKIKPVAGKKFRVDIDVTNEGVSTKGTAYATYSISQKNNVFIWQVQVTEFVADGVHLTSLVPLVEAYAISDAYGWPVEGTTQLTTPSADLKQDAVKLNFEQMYLLVEVTQALFPRFVTTPVKSGDDFAMSVYERSGMVVGEDGRNGTYSTLKGYTVRNGVRYVMDMTSREGFDLSLVSVPDKKMNVIKLESMTLWNAEDFFCEYHESSITVSYPELPEMGEMTSSVRFEAVD